MQWLLNLDVTVLTVHGNAGSSFLPLLHVIRKWRIRLLSVSAASTSTKPKAIPNKSDYRIVVYPAPQPYIGGISGTMFHYSERELEENCDALRKYIEMNKDLVATTWVLYDSWFCPNCHRQCSDQQAASECCWCEDCDE